MTEWDEYYLTKTYGYTPEEEAYDNKIERVLRYAMLAIFVLALILCTACIELS